MTVSSLGTHNMGRSGIGTEIECIGITQTFQFCLSRSAAHTALAMQQQHLARILHTARHHYFNLLQGNVYRLWKMAGVELGRASYINHQRSVFQERQRVLG